MSPNWHREKLSAQIAGIPLDIWNTEVETLLEERGVTAVLDESDEDLALPYFVTRTITDGLRRGTLADLALTIYYGNDVYLGRHTLAYAKKAFALASGIEIVWSSAEISEEMVRLREEAD